MDIDNNVKVIKFVHWKSIIDNEGKENIRSLMDNWHRFYLSQR